MVVKSDGSQHSKAGRFKGAIPCRATIGDERGGELAPVARDGQDQRASLALELAHDLESRSICPVVAHRDDHGGDGGADGAFLRALG